MSSEVFHVGFVHTVPPLAAEFHDLVTEQAARVGRAVEQIHVVDPWLLRTAMTAGVIPEVIDRLSAHVEHLARRGVVRALVTCSSLGEATEQLSTSLPSVIRIDQAMADHAVALAGAGGRITVLATVASTVGPTERLLARCAERAGFAVRTETAVLDEAGRARTAGAQDRHDSLVAEAIARWAHPDRADVVVLAQASMAHLGPDSDTLRGVPVLTSPTLAVQRLLSS